MDLGRGLVETEIFHRFHGVLTKRGVPLHLETASQAGRLRVLAGVLEVKDLLLTVVVMRVLHYNYLREDLLVGGSHAGVSPKMISFRGCLVHDLADLRLLELNGVVLVLRALLRLEVLQLL